MEDEMGTISAILNPLFSLLACSLLGLLFAYKTVLTPFAEVWSNYNPGWRLGIRSI